MKVKGFFGKTGFGGLFFVFWGFVGLVVSPPCPVQNFPSVKRNSKIAKDLVISQNHLDCTFKRLKSLCPVRAEINFAMKTR